MKQEEMTVASVIPGNIKLAFNYMRIIAFLFLLIILISGCRSTRKISDAMNKKDTAFVVINPTETDSAKLVHEAFAKIEKNRIDFNTFSAKIKTSMIPISILSQLAR